jgi:hypothetical protein
MRGHMMSGLRPAARACICPPQVQTILHPQLNGVNPVDATHNSAGICCRNLYLNVPCAGCCLALHVQTLAVCSASQRQVYISKSMTNVATLQKLHEGVFLGEH